MNRRTLISSLGAVCLSRMSGLAAEAAARPQGQPINFAKDELRKMYNNRLRLARPNAVCPLPESSTIKLRYTYRYRHYQDVTSTDTFMTSWASDGNLYSTYADGTVAGEDGRPVQALCTLQGNDWYFRRLGVLCPLGRPGTAENPPKFEYTREVNHPTLTGNAVLIGDDPFELRIYALPHTPLMTPWYPACYPSGCLVKDGIWYYACHYRGWYLDANNRQLSNEQGPNRFRISRDLGKTWEWSRYNDRDPVIPEVGRCAGGAPVKLGTSKFVDFGKNMQHSPDGYAYLVGHGTRHPDGVSNWNAGDAVFLARVMPTPEAINNKASFEYFSGVQQNGAPRWAEDYSQIQPVFEWPCRCGLPAITYFAELKKYIAVLCVGWPDGIDGQYDHWIAEADALWGPWSKVAYWDAFADEAYYVQIPSKFVRPDGRFVLFYAGGWSGVKPFVPAWKKKPAIAGLPNAMPCLNVAEFQLCL